MYSQRVKRKWESEIYELGMKHNFLISPFTWDKVWIKLCFFLKKTRLLFTDYNSFKKLVCIDKNTSSLHLCGVSTAPCLEPSWHGTATLPGLPWSGTPAFSLQSSFSSSLSPWNNSLMIRQAALLKQERTHNSIYELEKEGMILSFDLEWAWTITVPKR